MSESRGPNLRQALHRTARHHADNEALVDSQHRYTYRQMLERAQQTARCCTARACARATGWR